MPPWVRISSLKAQNFFLKVEKAGFSGSALVFSTTDLLLVTVVLLAYPHILDLPSFFPVQLPYGLGQVSTKIPLRFGCFSFDFSHFAACFFRFLSANFLSLLLRVFSFSGLLQCSPSTPSQQLRGQSPRSLLPVGQLSSPFQPPRTQVYSSPI